MAGRTGRGGRPRRWLPVERLRDDMLAQVTDLRHADLTNADDMCLTLVLLAERLGLGDLANELRAALRDDNGP